MKRILALMFVVFGISFSNTLHAQAEDDNDTDKTEINFLKFRMGKFQLLDEDKRFPVKVIMKDDDMRTLFEGRPFALEQYNKYRTLKRTKNIARFVGISAMVAGGVLFIQSLSLDETAYETAAGVCYVGGLVTLLGVSLPLRIAANNHALRAADSFNIEMEKEKRKYSLHFGIMPHGVGLVVNF